MHGIAIDLATATNVMVVVVNLVLVALNIHILNQVLQLRVDGSSSPARRAVGTGSARSGTVETEKFGLLPVRSASDASLAERERLRKDADRLEDVAAPIVEGY